MSRRGIEVVASHHEDTKITKDTRRTDNKTLRASSVIFVTPW